MAAQVAAQMQPGEAPLEDLMGVCREANRKICRYVREETLRAMGTTAAMLCISGEEASLCSVGDSRIFRLRRGRLEQLNRLHTEPCAFGNKPGLYQYLGIPETEQLLEPDLRRERLRQGDEYLLCTDGLTDMLTQTEMEQILNEQPAGKAAQQLLEAALERGGKDNITLILCRAEEVKETMAIPKKEVPVKKKRPRKSLKRLLLAVAAIVLAALAAAAGYCNAPVQIRIVRQPDKTQYLYADRLEPEGLALEVTYRSGRTETVTGGYTLDNTLLTQLGEQTVTVMYEGQTAAFSVTVAAAPKESHLP
jgi:serine/threonine protein phosphatase PrpC